MSAELATIQQIKKKKDMYAIHEDNFIPNKQIDISGMFPETTLIDKKIVLDIEEPQEYISTVSNVDPFDDDSGVALYQFDGDVLDTGGNYHGTNSGVTFESGKYNQCGYFDGNHQITTNVPYFTGDFTISAHIKTDGTAGGYLASEWNSSGGYGIFISIGHDAIGLGAYNGTNQISTWGLVDHDNGNSWNHVTFSFNGTTDVDGVKLFFNGKEVGSGSSTSAVLSGASHPLYIGTTMHSTQFDGKIDQFRIFNRALNEKEINILYNEKIERHLT